MAERQARRIKVWDPALRVCHWLLAVFVIANWLLGQFGPNIMTLHFYFGYAITALLIFRVIWGFIGPESARFSNLFHTPGTMLAYFRRIGKREPSHWHGHNPLGALSVIAMLAVLFWQVGTGLITDPEDFVNVGPLAGWVSSDTATSADGWHALGANLILIVVLLHIAAILFYRIWKNEDLIKPMITGWKWVRGR